MVPGRRNEQQQCLFHMLHNSCLLDYCTILKFIIRNSDSSQASCIQMTFEYCLWFRLLQIFSPGVIFQMWSKRRWGMQDEQQTKVHLRNSGNSSSPYVFLYSDITCHINKIWDWHICCGTSSYYHYGYNKPDVTILPAMERHLWIYRASSVQYSWRHTSWGAWRWQTDCR